MSSPKRDGPAHECNGCADKFRLYLKRSAKKKMENTGITFCGCKHEAIAYAMGYHKALRQITGYSVFSVLVLNEWGSIIYEKT